ncbi:MAG TPA: PEP-CTERM sorting domain-containing protein [Verrucomicrobiae bacterium]|nr:PEP-CTERM sorting domain-containing protein [Verrucomicrobiae bacterium]
MTKAFKIALFAAVTLLLAAAPAALADTASMTLTSAGNNTVNGVYVGPYTATINGNTTPVICDDYSHDSYVGESWTAYVSTLANPTYVRFTGGNETQTYDEVAFLANILFGLSGNNKEADALQYAIWYLTGSPSTQATISALSFFNDSSDVYGIQYWLNQAGSQQYYSGEFSNILIYTPTSGGNPQEFIVRTPEPATVLLLGLALAGLLMLKRRQKLPFAI